MYTRFTFLFFFLCLSSLSVAQDDLVFLDTDQFDISDINIIGENNSVFYGDSIVINRTEVPQKLIDKLERRYQNQVTALRDSIDGNLLQSYAGQEKINLLKKQTEIAVNSAVKLSQEFRKIDYQRSTDTYQEAKNAFEEGDFESAIALISDLELLAEDYKNAENRMLQGRLYIVNFQFSEGEKSFDRALKIYPDDLGNVQEVGSYYANQGNYYEAFPILERGLGLVHKLQSDSTREITAESRIKAFVPGFAIVRILLSLSLDSQQLDKVEIYLQIMENTLTGLMDAADQIPNFELQNTPVYSVFMSEFCNVWNERGIYYFHQQDTSAALQQFGDILFFLNEVEARMDEDNLEYLDESQRLELRAKVHKLLGRVKCEQMNRIKEGLAHFDTSLALNIILVDKFPNSQDLLWELAEDYKFIGYFTPNDRDRSIRYLEQSDSIYQILKSKNFDKYAGFANHIIAHKSEFLLPDRLDVVLQDYSKALASFHEYKSESWLGQLYKADLHYIFGMLYPHLEDKSLAINHLDSTLHIYFQLSKQPKTPDLNSRFLRSYNLLIDICNETQNYESLYRTYANHFQSANELFEVSPQQYSYLFKIHADGSFEHYLSMGNLSAALDYYQRQLDAFNGPNLERTEANLLDGNRLLQLQNYTLENEVQQEVIPKLSTLLDELSKAYYEMVELKNIPLGSFATAISYIGQTYSVVDGMDRTMSIYDDAIAFVEKQPDNTEQKVSAQLALNLNSANNHFYLQQYQQSIQAINNTLQALESYEGVQDTPQFIEEVLGACIPIAISCFDSLNFNSTLVDTEELLGYHESLDQQYEQLYQSNNAAIWWSIMLIQKFYHASYCLYLYEVQGGKDYQQTGMAIVERAYEILTEFPDKNMIGYFDSLKESLMKE